MKSVMAIVTNTPLEASIRNDETVASNDSTIFPPSFFFREATAGI
jgi:hypothetical protein